MPTVFFLPFALRLHLIDDRNPYFNWHSPDYSPAGGTALLIAGLAAHEWSMDDIREALCNPAHLGGEHFRELMADSPTEATRLLRAASGVGRGWRHDDVRCLVVAGHARNSLNETLGVWDHRAPAPLPTPSLEPAPAAAPPMPPIASPVAPITDPAPAGLDATSTNAPASAAAHADVLAPIADRQPRRRWFRRDGHGRS